MVIVSVQFARPFSTSCILRDIVQAILGLLITVGLVSSFNGKSKVEDVQKIMQTRRCRFPFSSSTGVTKCLSPSNDARWPFCSSLSESFWMVAYD